MSYFILILVLLLGMVGIADEHKHKRLEGSAKNCYAASCTSGTKIYSCTKCIFKCSSCDKEYIDEL